ncbi:MAG TPA: hypothetical protein VF365_02055 [Candidatus Limnocylindria bacterium]
MRNLMEQLSARHFVVLSLALMLVLGGVSAAFADRGDEQARREESLAADAVAVDDTDDDDDSNGDTRLSRMTASQPTSPADAATVTDDDGAAATDNDGTDSDGVDTGADDTDGDSGEGLTTTATS